MNFDSHFSLASLRFDYSGKGNEFAAGCRIAYSKISKAYRLC
jgi:hypothetical protein